MVYKELSLYNFKNFDTLDIELFEGINCFVGHNGAGKTNILDSLHYLSMTKSSINSVDSASIKFGEQQFMIKGIAHVKKSKHSLLCTVALGKKKDIKVDSNTYEKMSQHIGRFPLIMISPNDTHLIYEGNEVRRKFFDAAISQANPVYLQHLIAYGYALKSRNALLKKYAETRQPPDEALVQTYTGQLIKHGRVIYNERNSYLGTFLKLFKAHYEALQKQNETVSITYTSHLANANNPALLYANSWPKDLLLQRTEVGIHKDGFGFTINEVPLKKHGSQGQQKTFLVALKLAQFELLAKQKKIKPVLLLDDIFDKLDDERMHELLKKVASKQYGQLFITDARPERTLKILSENKLKARIFEIDKAKVIKTTNI